MIIPVEKVTAHHSFHVLLKPIGPLCNLDCDYCFYLDKADYFPDRTRFEMGDDVLESHIKSYIEGQPRDCREVTFGWQGGEPTLRGLPFYRRAVSLQTKYQRAGMRIVNTFQTNGILIDDCWAQFFKQHDFLVGISIDGDEELHDHYRKTRSGHGSYHKVLKGLQCLQRNGVDYNVLATVHAHNGNHGERVYQHLTSVGAKFIQFIPVVEAIKGQGVSKRSVGSEQFGRFMLEVFDCWRKKDIGRVFVSHFDNALGMNLGMPSSVCVHSQSCGNNLVTEHNGDTYSCDHFVYPENKLGNIKRSDYPELIETPIQQDFSLGKKSASDTFCDKCDQRDLCHGGCPAQRIGTTGELSFGNRHYLCESYYLFFSTIRPYLNAMSECLRNQVSVCHYLNFMPFEKSN